MNIAITFRNLEASEAVKEYAHEKVAKLQKFLRQPMRARVTIAIENKQQCSEVEVSAGSSHFHAKERGDDMYKSIDHMIDKIERQISGAHGSDITRKKGGDNAGAFAAAMSSDPVSLETE
jgi:putative sigma-54 modulation protein